LTIYTSLFVQSKNFEVEPLSITDVTQHLLKNIIDTRSVINKEYEIRKLIAYENETATLFDFIMHFTKVWKIELMHSIRSKHIIPTSEFYEHTYEFMSEVEALTYDFCKSILIDAELQKFKPSLLVVSTLTISIDLMIRTSFSKEKII